MLLRPAARSSRSGFSLTELIIVSGVLALVLGSTALVTLTSTAAQQHTSAKNRVLELARRASDRAADELMNASDTSLFPNPQPFGTDDLLFQTAVGVTAGAVDWSTPKRLAFRYDTGELDDGADNNDNGLVDEGALVLTTDDGGPDERTIILCRGVRELAQVETANGDDDNGNGLVDESGFSVQRIGDMLLVRLTIEKQGPEGEMLTSTVETGVRLRN
jgi:prepilin-type N-terminal cleavage/methylation domain-containing protein